MVGLVAGAYWLGRTHSPVTAPIPASEPPAEAVDPAPAPALPDPAPPRAVDRRPADGVVVGPDGAPVADARVVMAGPYLHPQQEVVADRLGRFWRPEVAEGRVDLWVYAPGLSAPVQEGVDFGDGDEQLRIKLAAASHAQGRVQEAGSGKRIGGALVRLLPTWPAVVSRQARTRPDGTFDLGPVTSGTYAAYVEANGYIRLRGDALELNGAPWVIELSPGAMLQVIVRASDGAAAAGARVRVGDLQGEADVEGRLMLRGLPAGRSRASASHPVHGRGRSAPVMLTDGVVSEAVVMLRQGERVRGRVVDEGGAPIAAAKVVQEVEDASTVVTDDQGRFELEADGSGVVDLVVSKDGYLKTVTSVRAGDSELLIITLTRPFKPIEGWVLSPAGGELPGAQVRLLAKGGSLAAKTGSGGRFEFHPGFDGPYRTVASHPEYAESLPATVDANGQVTVSVREPAELLLEIVEAVNFDPLANAQVALSGPEQRKGRSDGMGGVRFGRLPAGRYRVDVTADWRMPASKRVEAKAGPASVALQVPLVAAGRLRVRVQAADTGEDIDGALVSAGAAKVRASKGLARLDSLPEGDLALIVTAKGFDTWRRTVPVLPGETGDEEVFLERKR